MKLGKKLMVALGILSLFVIVSGLVGVLSTAAINAKLDVVTQITSPTVEEVDDMVIALWKINQLMQKFSTESDRESLEELKQESQKVSAEIVESEIQVIKVVEDTRILEQIERAAEKIEHVEEHAVKVINLRLTELESTDPVARSLYRSNKRDALVEVETGVVEAVAILEEIAVRAQTFSIDADQESLAAVKNTLIALLIMMVVSIGCAVFILVYLSRSIIQPIDTLSEAAKKVSTGDFSVELEERESDDEIADLTSTFNQMTKSLKSMIEESPRMKKFLQLKPHQKGGRQTVDLALKSSYMIKAESAEKGLVLFWEKIQKGFHGVCITRTNPSVIKEKYELEQAEFVWLSETKDKQVKTASDLTTVFKVIKGAIHKYEKTIVLLDRVDYLIAKHGFNRVLKFILAVNDEVMVSNTILLLPVDPSTVSLKELSYLEKELEDLPQPVAQTTLPSDLLGILKFIRNGQAMGKIVTYKDVGREFHITAPTTQKRIKELEAEGLIRVVKQGRDKVLSLTTAGESVIV